MIITRCVSFSWLTPGLISQYRVSTGNCGGVKTRCAFILFRGLLPGVGGGTPKKILLFVVIYSFSRISMCRIHSNL